MNNEISKVLSSVTASFAAVIIPDTPIVSIAGATLSEITTTTTSTSTTPIPTPIVTDNSSSTKHTNKVTNIKKSPYTPMSEAATKTAGAAAAVAADATAVVAACSGSGASGAIKKEPLVQQHGKQTSATDEATIETKLKKEKSKDKSEESRINELDDCSLKELLEEAFSYKNPGDKKNKSEMFLQLLEKVQNETEDQNFSFRAITSRFPRNSSSSTTNSASSSQHNNHQNHNHHNNPHLKQGGSLQDLVEAVHTESLLDGVGGPRNRRHNHNSRQKKYSSVSTRQREGGSLPSNVNVTNCSGLFGNLEQPLFMCEVAKSGINFNKQQQRRNLKAAAAAAAAAVTSKEPSDLREPSSSSASIVEECSVASDGDICNSENIASIGYCTTPIDAASVGDCVIDIGDSVLDIQQQQKIMQSKGTDTDTQRQAYYEHTTSEDEGVCIPRTSISRIQPKPPVSCNARNTGSGPGGSSLGSSGGSANGKGDNGTSASEVALGFEVCKPSMATLDSKCFSLDENYKSCKSLLGEKGSDMVNRPTSAIYATTKTITRQIDENGNSLNKIYQANTQAAAAIMNVSVDINTNAVSSTSAVVNASIGQSQATKATKSKKKSQQERNTKTVDVESVAGYRGKDPIDDLVKYIENTENKLSDSGNNGSGNGNNGNSANGNGNNGNGNGKKKERKKDKQPKIKKSNSLEELRSCAKIDVDNLKQTAATTESNVMMRNKGNGKNTNSNNNKNNFSSTADINKNFESSDSKEIHSHLVAVNKSAVSTNAAAVATQLRKGERRSWGPEELQYLGDSNCSSIEEKTKDRKTKNKEREPDKEKDKTTERNEKNATASTTSAEQQTPSAVSQSHTIKQFEVKPIEKRKKSSNLTIVDFLAMESMMPETAEFHVVTKKKKPKKPRNVTSEETSNNSVTTVINRSHNFMTGLPKSNTFIQQQLRHKQYSNVHASSNNERGVGDNYNHYNNNNYSVNNYHQTYPQNHQNNQQQHQQQHNTRGDNKSRRKSTSSMPPSEKSDSSDLDSVHSLPIESTTKNKQRHSKITTVATSAPISTTNKHVVNGGASLPTISYADIARINQERALAATESGVNSADKWPTVDAANNINSPLDQSTVLVLLTNLLDETQTPNATAAQNICSVNTLKPKTKRQAIKPDFPELIATTTVSGNIQTQSNADSKANILKPISYSQSLIAVQPSATLTQVFTKAPALTSSAEVLLPSPAIKIAATAEASENHNVEKYGHGTDITAIRMPASSTVTITTKIDVVSGTPTSRQQQTQQPLQKSKSVENESYNYNSNNLDQQYPALEKTVKRHSANNVAIATSTASNSIATGLTAQFNFAAAAKQQIIHTSNEYLPKSGTPTLAAIIATTVATTIPTTTSTSASKKPKDKITNLAATTTMPSTSTNPHSIVSETTTNTMRKSKRERHIQIVGTTDETPASIAILPDEYTTHTVVVQTQKLSTATQTNVTNYVAVCKNVAGKVNKSIKATCSSVQAAAEATAATDVNTTTTTTLTSNTAAIIPPTTITPTRPAVIILNDDRTRGASNEFTFGDFNEDELKFFEDDGMSDDVGLDDTDDQPTLRSENSSCKSNESTAEVVVTNKCSLPFNDSGSSLDAAIMNADGIMMVVAGVDSSSPNSSLNVADVQLNDSGISTTSKKSKSISNSIASNTSQTSSSNVASTKRQTPLYHHETADSNKLNTFLNTPAFGRRQSGGNAIQANNSKTTATTTAKGNCTAITKQDKKNALPPQQLETCNDIETVIIAAARAAAQQQQQQQQKNQKKYKNSSSSSNSSSFSSSSSISVDASGNKLVGPHITPTISNIADNSVAAATCDAIRETDVWCEGENDVTVRRSRSNSPASQPMRVKRKEFDLRFIPPATRPSAYSTLQQNEIIVDFIGSAWEEVANSKVTKYYDGQ